MFRSLDELVMAARERGLARIAVAAGHDPDVIAALKQASDMGLADGILVGNEQKIRALAGPVDYYPAAGQIIHEPDDIRSNNPASNYELLTYLQKELIEAKYNLKHLYRLILNSKTYQLSSIPRSNDPRNDIYFARYPIRRLEAEVLIDALNQITGTTEKYGSPFTITRRVTIQPK